MHRSRCRANATFCASARASSQLHLSSRRPAEHSRKRSGTFQRPQSYLATGPGVEASTACTSVAVGKKNISTCLVSGSRESTAGQQQLLAAVRISGVVVPNLNVGGRAPSGCGAEQAVQGLDVGARACWEVGVGGGLEERGEEGGLCDGQLGVGSHDLWRKRRIESCIGPWIGDYRSLGRVMSATLKKVREDREK